MSPGMGLPCEEGKRVVTPLSEFHHMSHREATMQTSQSSCPGSPPDTGDGWEPVLRQGEVDFGGSGKKRGKVGVACIWGTSTMPGILKSYFLLKVQYQGLITLVLFLMI